QRTQKFGSGDRTSSAIHQVAKKLKLTARKIDLFSGANHFCSPDIYSDRTKLANSLSRADGQAPQEGLNTRNQLGGLERLRDVVVGAEIESNNLIDRLIPDRQHQNRSRHPLLADAAANIESAAIRQHDIQDNQIEGQIGGLAQSL